MSSFDQAWADADPDKVGTDNGEPPAPGTYTATLAVAEAFTSKKDEAWVKFVWRLLDQTDEWSVLYGFRSQAAANVAKNQIREVGVDVDNVAGLDGLDAALKQVVGGYFDIEVVQSGEFLNTYVRGKATSELPDSVPAAAVATAQTDSVPF